VNLLSIMRWPLIFGAFCTVLGIFINNEIVPRGHEVRRSVARRISVGAGLELLEPGRVIDDFPNAKIFFESREGDWIRELVVLDYSNPSFDRHITASKALVKSEGWDVVLDLYDMTIDPVDECSMNMARAARFQYRVKDALKDGKYNRKMKDFTLFPRVNADGTVRSEMLSALAEAKRDVRQASGGSRVKGTERNLARRALSRLETEFMRRWVSAFAAVCFVLVGVPLGIRAQRRESTIGMAIALVTALGYNLVVLLMTSLAKNFTVHPEYLIWLPVLICLALAAWLIPKNL
jgi:lipopolysaccharide export system permease protein